MYFQTMNIPFGPITLFSTNDKIISIKFCKTKGYYPNEILNEASFQINAYFNGRLNRFDLPIKTVGTAFQKKVWKQIIHIPYGKTLNYKQIAINLKSSPRAVGHACGKNPIPIIIPCHRVLGSNNKLGGYSFANGKQTKLSLLKIENINFYSLSQ